MAKVEIIRSFLASRRSELPPTSEGVRKHITDIVRGLNFRITSKEMQSLMAEFAPKEEKRSKRGTKTAETTGTPFENK